VLGHLSGFWQLSRSTFGQVSFTGLYGTGSDSATVNPPCLPPGGCSLTVEQRIETSLRAVAARFTWRPPGQALRREVTVRGELFQLHRLADGVGPTRLGWYLDGTTRLGRRWILGVRYDRVESPTPPWPGASGRDPVTHLLAERIRVPPRAVDAPPRPSRRHHRPPRPAGGLGDGPHKHELF